VANRSQVVRIRDAGSMHGTFLNDEPLEREVARPLGTGDEVTFGSSVYRNQKTFKPATVTVGVEFQTASVLATIVEAETTLTMHCSGQAGHSPSRVFTVPDDCSTDENETFDENASLKIPAFSSHEVNPWMMRPRDAIRQVDGIIEIDSTSESDSDIPNSDALPHDCISILSSDDDQDAVDSRDMGAENDDDGSISLTDDETSSTPASPVESFDIDNFGHMDNVGNRYNAGARSPSWDSASTDPQSEDAEGRTPSGHNSEDEQGVFLYDTESEEVDEMNEIDPIDVIDSIDDIDPVDLDKATDTQHSVHESHPFPAQAALPAVLTSVYPTLPPIDTAILSQQEVPQFNCRLAPVQQAPRQPSPSDAVLPPALRHHGSEDDCSITVESLGLKSGKPEYFQAREQNKITAAHSHDHYTPDTNPFPQVPSDIARAARAARDALRRVTDGVPQYPASSATEFGHASTPAFDKDAPTLVMPQPANGGVKSKYRRGFLTSLQEAIALGSEEVSSTSPPRESSEVDIEIQDSVDASRIAGSARAGGLFSNSTQAQIEAPEGLAIAAMTHEKAKAKAPVAAERAETPRETVTKKRKAVDISEGSDMELVRQKKSTPDQQPQSSSPAPVQSGIEMDLSTLSFHDTTEQEPTAVRPTKMRKIAERMGYAALGGATVGAMVLTSLIYTAPSFA
jgi:hypothetical protein